MAGKKSQREKELQRRLKQKKQEKDRHVQRVADIVENRHGLLVAKTEPISWQGEIPEDAALFDDAVLQTLPEDSAEKARLVRLALEETLARKTGVAYENLASIPRQSPYANWRLFIRGLIAWQNNDFAEVDEAWERLDKSRRPWRIAVSLRLAQREDLTAIKHDGAPEALMTEASWIAGFDPALLNHAKLVRQRVIERIAIRAARDVAKINIPHELKDTKATPQHIFWLSRFTKNYGDIEPELVRDLQRTLLHQAFAAPYIELFKECASQFKGFDYDPNNTLIRAMNAIAFGEVDEANILLKSFEKREIHKITTFPQEALRGIVGGLYFFCAERLIEEARKSNPFPFPTMFYDAYAPVDAIEGYFEESIDAYPRHRNVYTSFEEWLQHEFDKRDRLKDEQVEHEDKIANLKMAMLKEFPNEVEARMEVIDYLFERERSEEAKPHVEFLSGTRHKNPLANAMQWKWHILEAIRLSRRKVWVPQALESLDAAEREWPEWLRKAWLPYLRAAVKLRGGDTTAFDTIPESERASKIADACMRLAAAQKMSVPAADLKPLRGLVDECVNNLEKAAFKDLLLAVNFFWDLQRIKIKYPAYRQHGSKIQDRFLELLDERSFEQFRGTLELTGSLLKLANDGYFTEYSSVKLPNFLDEEEREVQILAVTVAAANKIKYFRNVEQLLSISKALRFGFESVSDLYYRYYFESLLDSLDQRLEEQAGQAEAMARFFERIPAGAMEAAAKMFEECSEDGDWDDDDDWDDDE